jgi:4-amino-4-deoxy-L-arabinose transferase-like glycosyltransferase
MLQTRLPRRSALLWTYALALYAPFAIVLGTIQKEPLAVLLVALAMLGCSRGLGGGRPVALAGAGAALGALAMVRLEYGWVVLALLGLALAACAVRRGRPRGRRAAAVAAAAALACVPWLGYTERVTGQVLYWGSSSGLSLFWMSPTLPGETGQWHSPVRVHHDPALAPYRPLFRRLDEVHPLESDRTLRRLALGNIRARPAAYARNLAANAARLLVFVPTRPAQAPAEVAMYAFGNGTLLAGLAWACPVLWRRRRSLPPEAVPFMAFTALAVAVHLPPSASPRMLIPVVPVLLWIVAQAAAAAAGPRHPPPGPSRAQADGRRRAAAVPEREAAAVGHASG